MSGVIVSRWECTHLGLDVHRDSISVAILSPESEAPVVDRIPHAEASIRRLVARLGPPHRLRACYEAGPTGYGLARLLSSMGVGCDVVAPALIPVAPGDRVKTDRRDASRLARLHRIGELAVVRVPTEAEEGVRDLCRARTVAIRDRRRIRQRLSALLLRQGLAYRAGRTWTHKHVAWLAGLSFEDPGTQQTFRFYFGAMSARDAEIASLSADVADWSERELFADRVDRLVAYRGIDRIGAMTLVTEICDWRRFGSARKFMGFCGLVPSEYSTGESTRRGPITRAGNPHVRVQLVESAWAYRYPARITPNLAKRQQRAHPDTVARAWVAQQRLCGRYRRLTRTKDRKLAITAIARELAGFVWAEMTAQ